MGIIEKLNDNPKLGFGVGAAILVLGLGFIVLQSSGGSHVAVVKKAHYTDDNGKTFFRDSVNKIPPFDRGGKQAYRADVFKCPAGHEYVGLIHRFTPEGRAEMESHIAQRPHDPEGSLRMGIERRQMEMRKPSDNEKAWTPQIDDAVTERMMASVKCHCGQTGGQLVIP
jgi:hypothetical protein